MKRLLSLLIAAIMLLAIVPTALADEEPVTLTLSYQSSRPINEYTELTHQYIKDNLGIDINLIQGGDNWKQQLSLYITSGDIPDYMTVSGVELLLNSRASTSRGSRIKM